jgi:hypothetical protein
MTKSPSATGRSPPGDHASGLDRLEREHGIVQPLALDRDGCRSARCLIPAASRFDPPQRSLATIRAQEQGLSHDS